MASHLLRLRCSDPKTAKTRGKERVVAVGAVLLKRFNGRNLHASLLQTFHAVIVGFLFMMKVSD